MKQYYPPWGYALLFPCWNCLPSVLPVKANSRQIIWLLHSANYVNSQNTRKNAIKILTKLIKTIRIQISLVSTHCILIGKNVFENELLLFSEALQALPDNSDEKAAGKIWKAAVNSRLPHIPYSVGNRRHHTSTTYNAIRVFPQYTKLATLAFFCIALNENKMEEIAFQ